MWHFGRLPEFGELPTFGPTSIVSKEVSLSVGTILTFLGFSKSYSGTIAVT
jgi:hypothetical protein